MTQIIKSFFQKMVLEYNFFLIYQNIGFLKLPKTGYGLLVKSLKWLLFPKSIRASIPLH